MKVTIGEVVNELLNYTNLIQVNTVKDLPFLRAYVSGGNGKFTKCFIYIVQEKENQYSVCDYSNDSNGERVLVTGELNRPFEIEKDINKSGNNKSDLLHIKKHIKLKEVIHYLHETLYNYEITKFDPRDRSQHLSKIIIHKQRLRRIIDKSMKEFKWNGTIGDMIDNVYIKKIPIPLNKIKDYEIRYMRSRLKQFGLYIIIENESIVDIKLMLS